MKWSKLWKLKLDIIFQFRLREAVPLSFMISKIFTSAFYVQFCNTRNLFIRRCKLILITVTFNRLPFRPQTMFFKKFFSKLNIKITFKTVLFILTWKCQFQYSLSLSWRSIRGVEAKRGRPHSSLFKKCKNCVLIQFVYLHKNAMYSLTLYRIGTTFWEIESLTKRKQI